MEAAADNFSERSATKRFTLFVLLGFLVSTGIGIGALRLTVDNLIWRFQVRGLAASADVYAGSVHATAMAEHQLLRSMTAETDLGMLSDDSVSGMPTFASLAIFSGAGRVVHRGRDLSASDIATATRLVAALGRSAHRHPSVDLLIWPDTGSGQALYAISQNFARGQHGFVVARRASPVHHLSSVMGVSLVPTLEPSQPDATKPDGGVRQADDHAVFDASMDFVEVRRSLGLGGLDLMVEMSAETLRRERAAILTVVSVAVFGALVIAFGLIFGIGRDLILKPTAALRRSETRLRRSEQQARRLSVALESTSDHVIITDAESCAIWVNQAICETTGFDRHDFIGRNPRELLWGPLTPDAVKIAVEKARASRSSLKFRTVNHKRSGEAYTADVSLTPIATEGDSTVSYVSIGRNVTETYKAEQRLQAAVDAMIDGFAVVGRDGRFRIANAAYKRRIAELGATVDVGTLYVEMIRALAAAEVCSFNGLSSEAWIAENIDAFEAGISRDFLAIDINGTANLRRHRCLPSGDTVMLATDVTELTEARQRAEAAVEAKSQFTASISHELRTPLNGVISIADLLLERPLEDDLRTSIKLIRQSGHALLMIINDLLDMSKLEFGRMTLRQEPFDLVLAAQDVCHLLAQGARDKGIELTLRHDPDMPRHVIGDQGRHRQILTNLIGNAIKFTDQGGVTVDLQAEVLGDNVRVVCTVSDTGEGISADDLSRIFAPYQQSTSLRAAKAQEGTGLGLSICRALAALMGGTLEASSTLGKGSSFTFSVTLPVDGAVGLHQDTSRGVPFDVSGGRASPTAGAGPSDQGDTAAGGVPPLVPPLVLAVEDNATNRFILKAMLAGQNLRLVLCATAAEALAAAACERPTVILMDVHLPDASGSDTMRALHAAQADAGLCPSPVYAYTAGLTEAEERDCMESGMVGIIRKPVQKSELLHILAPHLELDRGHSRQTPVKVIASCA